MCVHVSEQWKNLKEYFFKFLTKEKTFKQRMAPTSRYQWLKAVSVSDLTIHCIVFYAFITQNLEALLVPSQSKQAVVHFFPVSMCNLVSDIMSIFIKKKVVSNNNFEITLMNIPKYTNYKYLKHIDIGAKTKMIFWNAI